MYSIKNILSFFLFILCIYGSLFAAIDYKVENQPAAFEQTLAIHNQGVLKQNENGFFVLERAKTDSTQIHT